jgi:hypothetical protein
MILYMLVNKLHVRPTLGGGGVALPGGGFDLPGGVVVDLPGGI